MSMDPVAEDGRLRELYRFQILDTRRQPDYDGLCELACRVAGTEMAAIGFVDRDRVWFKASVGLAALEVPREGSFSDRVIEHGNLYEVEDVRRDQGFSLALLSGLSEAPCFFAGVPLEVRKGTPIGALLVFGPEPRRLLECEKSGLRQVAAAIVDRLRLHRIRLERTRENARTRARNIEIAVQRAEIVKQRRLLEQTSRLARIGGWEYDVASRRLTWSPELYRIVEMDRGAPLRFEDVPKFYSPEIRDVMIANMKQALQNGKSFEAEAPIVTLQGRRRWVRFVCETESGRNGEVVRLLGTCQDVTEQRATEDRITFLASHDVVTRLPNRAVFQERLEAALKAASRDSDRGVGLVLIDIDHFKAVNDTLGHHAGDALLCEVGQRLVRTAGNALVARLGGDEFALVVSDVASEAELRQRVDHVTRALVTPVAYEDESIPVTTSIGYAVGRSGDPADQLLKDADIALYEAKGAGRNRAVLFDRSMRDEIELRQAILRAMRQAIERRELLLYYQPKVSLRNGALYGFEALLRWRRPDGFVAGPNFFGIALEDPQLSQVIGDLVIDMAIEQAVRWRDLGYDFGHIAINAATSQFRRGDLADLLLSGLERHRVPTSALMVEVTENVLLSRGAENVLATLQTLADRGVKIALDDFGTGYASLTHLKELPVDLLKIDRSFVSALAERRESQAIIRGISTLAHDLGMDVIAEGIETAQQRDLLRQLGPGYGQGYLFARPMPAEQAEAQFLSPALALDHA